MNIVNPYRFGEVDFLTGLVAYYKFENNVTDYTGTNNGTATSVTYTTGQVDDCAIFNGTTGSITIADNDSLSFTDGSNDVPFTFIFGIYLGTATGSIEYVINKRGNAVDYEWDIIRTATLLTITLYTGGTSTALKFELDISGLSLSTWYHVSYVYDGGGLTTSLVTRIDNSVQSTTNTSGTYVKMNNTTAQVRISARAWATATLRFSGRLDDFAIYKDRALTSGELTAAYNKFTAGDPLIA